MDPNQPEATEAKPARRRSARKPAPEPNEVAETASEAGPQVDDGETEQGAETARPKRRRGRRGGRNRNASAEVTEPPQPSDDAYVLQVEAWRAEAVKARVPLSIPEALISNDALRIVERLAELGHLSYVVGGCVRDLALGTEPKDFDVVTTARPQQVRRAFRYARIIGRRFRLVHVRFGRNRLIEVATFRAQVPEAEAGDDLLVREDNVYGSPSEDAMRRDFTVNGLFYDPISGVVVDHVQGMDDLRNKVIRSIGPAATRLQEDPVRMLRAIRFAAKLGFELEPSLERAVRKHGADILRCSPARLWDEVLKIMRSGYSARALPLAEKLGFLQHLLPEMSAVMAAHPDRYMQLLGALDALIAERGAPPDDLLLIAVLALPLLPTEAPRQHLAILMRDWNDRFRVPRRLRERLEDAVLGLRSMVPEGPWVDQDALARRALFGDAVDLLELLSRAAGEGRDLVKSWRRLERPEDENAE